MYNHCVFVGNLGRDPEVKYIADGTCVCNFTIACTEKWKDNEKTEWVSIVVWKRLAEVCGEYLTKGMRVLIAGRMQTSSWEKDGITRYKTEIVAHTMKMLGGKNENKTWTQEETPVTKTDDDIPF